LTCSCTLKIVDLTAKRFSQDARGAKCTVLRL
jgi:hypothetical protein